MKKMRKNYFSYFRYACLIVVLCIFLFNAGKAQSSNNATQWHWNGVQSIGTPGGGSGNWDTTTLNWLPFANGAFGTSDVWRNDSLKVAIFGGQGGTVNMNSNLFADSIYINSANYNFSTSRTISLHSHLRLGKILTFTNTTNNTLYLRDSISGDGGIIKEGLGRLMDSGVNMYKGVTIVNGGILFIYTGHELGTTDSGTIIADGATLQFGDVVVSSEPLFISGSGQNNIGAINNRDRSSFLNAPITLNNHARINSDKGTLNLNRNINLGAYDLTLGGIEGIRTNSNVINGTGKLIKDGTGFLQLFSGPHTYTGQTIIKSGTLICTVFPPQSAGLTIDSGAVWDVTGGTNSLLSLSSSQAVTVTASGYSQAAKIIVTESKLLRLSAAGIRFTNYEGGTNAPIMLDGYTGGALNLNNAAITINTTQVLQRGIYTLIAKTNIVNGVTGQIGALTITGSGIETGALSTLYIDSGMLKLKVYFDYYWNGSTTTNTGNGAIGGQGNWNATATNWILKYNNSNGIPLVWNNHLYNIVNFNIGQGNVDLLDSIVADTIRINTSGYNFVGSTNKILNSQLVLNKSIKLIPGVNVGFYLNGIVSGADSLVISGTGTVFLNTLNTYKGGTYLNSGILEIHPNNLRSSGILSSSAIGIGRLYLNGGQLRSNGTADCNIFNAVSLFKDMVIGDSIKNGNIVFNQPISLVAANRQIDTKSTTTFYNGITDSGSQLGFVKKGAASLLFAASSSYSGETQISEGKIGVLGTNALSANSIIKLDNAATALLDLNGYNQSIAALQGGGTIGGNVLLGSAQLTVNNALLNNTLYNGAISGTGGIVKAGKGIFSLTNQNAYTGQTIVNDGVLKLATPNGVNAIHANSQCNVNRGATLQIATNQVLGNVSVGDSGTLQVDSGVVLTINGNLEVSTKAVINIAGTITYANNSSLIYVGSGTRQAAAEWVDNTESIVIGSGTQIRLPQSLTLPKSNFNIVGMLNMDTCSLKGTVNNLVISGTLLTANPYGILQSSFGKSAFPDYVSPDLFNNAFVVNTTATVSFNSNSNQLIDNLIRYANLTLIGGGVKTPKLSADSTLHISVNFLIAEGTILDATRCTAVGNATTNLQMLDSSKLYLAGKTKTLLPAIGGVYSLSAASTIQLSGVGVVRTALGGDAYNNLILSGTDMDVPASGITMQAGTTCRILGKINVLSANGLQGFETDAAFLNTNNPTIVLGGNSIVHYAASIADQKVTARNDYKTVALSEGQNKIVSGNNAIQIDSLYIDNDSHFCINGSTLVMQKTISGEGTIVGGRQASIIFNAPFAGKLRMNQSVATHANPDSLSNSLNHLTINGGAVEIDTDVTIIGGLLNIHSGLIDLKGNVILKSFINSQAQVGATLGTINYAKGGRFVAERYITNSKRGYRNLNSSGIVTDGTMFDNWQEGGVNDNGYGMHITGIKGSAGVDANTGFDRTISGNASVWEYTTSDTWTAIPNTKYQKLYPFKGYFAVVRGNRSYNLFSFQPDFNVANAILRTRGKLITGTVYMSSDADVSYNSDGLNSLNFRLNKSTTPSNKNPNDYGFSLIGNPYACAIDWTSVYNNSGTSKNTLSPYYWVWNQSHNGGRGAWVTVDNSGLSTFAGNNSWLQPGQSFFIQNDHSGNPVTLEFNETNKWITGNHKVKDVFAETLKVQPIRIEISLVRKSTDTVVADAALIAFDAAFSNKIDMNDASKLANSTENIAIVSSKTALAIEKRNLPITTDSFPIRIWNVDEKTAYELRIDLTEYNSSATQRLKVWDRLLNKYYQLINNQVFTLPVGNNSDTISYKNRYVLLFDSVITLSNNKVQLSANAIGHYRNLIKWRVDASLINGVAKHFMLQKSNDNVHFQEVKQIPVSALKEYQLVDSFVTQTTYYRVVVQLPENSEWYSNVVQISQTKSSPSIQLYPTVYQQNTNAVMHMRTSGVVSDKIQLILYTADGKKVYENVVNNAANADISLSIPQLTKGAFYAVVFINNKEVYNKTIVVY